MSGATFTVSTAAQLVAAARGAEIGNLSGAAAAHMAALLPAYGQDSAVFA